MPDASESVPQTLPFFRRNWAGFGVESLLVLAVSFLLTWWLTGSGLEMQWQSACFHTENGDWSHGEAPLWRFIYEFAALPVLVICGGAIVVLVAGFRWPKLRAWRRVAWYSIALLFLGPGVITNLWMKDTWGRPRPREVEQFGGREAYETVFGLDFTGVGKSFPCGHATMGFFFLGAWFLLRGRRPGLAWAALIFSLGWGGLIGYTRMVQGGHFPTDVVWAAAVMWITAGFLYHLFRLNRRLLDPPGEARKIPLMAKLAGTGAVIALLAIVALATPYRAEREIVPHEPEAATAKVKGSIRVELGDVVIRSGEQLTVNGEAWGHGLPTSQISSRWEEEVEADGIWRFKLFQRSSGHFTEIRQNLDITVPWKRTEFLKLDLGPGETVMRLPALKEGLKVELILRDTDLRIELEPGATVSFESMDRFAFEDETGTALLDTSELDSAQYRFVSTEGDSGSVRVVMAPSESQ